jgi:hypothetical protein
MFDRLVLPTAYDIYTNKTTSQCQKVLRRIQNPNISKCIGLWFCSIEDRLMGFVFRIFAVGSADAEVNVAIKLKKLHAPSVNI